MQRKSENEKAAEVLPVAQRPPPSPNPKSRSRTFLQKNIRSRNARKRRPDSAFASTLRSILCIVTFGCIGKPKVQKKSRGQRKYGRSEEDKAENAKMLPRPITLEELIKLTTHQEESKEKDSLESYSTTGDESSVSEELEELTDEDISSNQSACMESCDKTRPEKRVCELPEKFMDTSSEKSSRKDGVEDAMMLPRPPDLEEMLELMNRQEESVKTDHAEPLNNLGDKSRVCKRPEKSKDEDTVTEQSVCMDTAEDTTTLPRVVILEKMSEVTNRHEECEKNDNAKPPNKIRGKRGICKIPEISMDEGTSFQQSVRKHTAEDGGMLLRPADLEDKLDLMNRRHAEGMKNNPLDAGEDVSMLPCFVVEEMLELINRQEGRDKNNHSEPCDKPRVETTTCKNPKTPMDQDTSYVQPVCKVAREDAVILPRPVRQEEMLDLINRKEECMETNHSESSIKNRDDLRVYKIHEKPKDKDTTTKQSVCTDTAEDAAILPRLAFLEVMLEFKNRQKEREKNARSEPCDKIRPETGAFKVTGKGMDQDTSYKQTVRMNDTKEGAMMLPRPVDIEGMLDLMNCQTDSMETNYLEPCNEARGDLKMCNGLTRSANEDATPIHSVSMEEESNEMICEFLGKSSGLLDIKGKKTKNAINTDRGDFFEILKSTSDSGYGNALEVPKNAFDGESENPIEHLTMSGEDYVVAGAECGDFNSSACKKKVMNYYPDIPLETHCTFQNVLDQLKLVLHSNATAKCSKVITHPR